MNELASFGALVAITIGITEVIKRATKAPTSIIPLIAFIVGFVLNLIGNVTNITSLTLLTGFAIGLSASGLFDQKKIVDLVRLVRKDKTIPEDPAE